MKNSKKKISFSKNELEMFQKNSELVIKNNALSRIEGGLYNQYLQKAYNDTTFVNYTSR